MKNKLVLTIIISAIAFAGLVSAQENKGPRIEVKEIQYNFGKVVQGTSVSHVFEVRNTGNEELIIEQVKTS